MIEVTVKELEGMIEHWLSTPVDGYLGSSYGQDIKALLQLPHSDTAADRFVRKLVKDIPLLSAMSPEQISVYSIPSGVDRLDLVLEVAGTTYNLGNRER